jgi:hypothetical protein
MTFKSGAHTGHRDGAALQHRHPGRGHPTAAVGISLLLLSVGARVAVATAVVLLLWAMMLWGMS